MSYRRAQNSGMLDGDHPKKQQSSVFDPEAFEGARQKRSHRVVNIEHHEFPKPLQIQAAGIGLLREVVVSTSSISSLLRLLKFFRRERMEFMP